MRVLQVLNNVTYGGIELMLFRSIHYLLDRGIQCDLCCMQEGDPSLERAFGEYGSMIYRIPKSSNPYRTAAEVQKILRLGRHQLVHSHLGYISGGVALGASREAFPGIISFHSAEPTTLWGWKERPILSSIRHQWLQWHRRLMDAHATLFVGHSHINIAAYEPKWNQNPDKYRILLNGIEIPECIPDRFASREKLGLLKKGPLLLHVANMRAIKNYEMLLSVAQGVRKCYPGMLLIIVGDGAYRVKIERMVAERGLSEVVHFAGQVSDTLPYYAAADLLIFPSHSEGCGNAVLEAQAAGIPVVASDIPAHRESVASDQRRFLFDLDNPQMAIEAALEQLDAAEKGTNSWVEEAHRFVAKNYSVQGMSATLASIYNDVIRP